MNVFLMTLVPFGMMAVGAALIFAFIHFFAPNVSTAPEDKASTASRSASRELKIERYRRRKAERTNDFLIRSHGARTEAAWHVPLIEPALGTEDMSLGAKSPEATIAAAISGQTIPAAARWLQNDLLKSSQVISTKSK